VDVSSHGVPISPPDGRLLCYFAHKPSAIWEHGQAHVALSRLPWLVALHAFGTCGTWTRGYYFTEEGGDDGPEHTKLPIPCGLRSIPAIQFANERRQGWEEAPDSSRRDPQDVWDEHRNARMQKLSPEATAFFAWKASAGQEASSELIRPSTACASTIGWKRRDSASWITSSGRIGTGRDTCWPPLAVESSKPGRWMAMPRDSCLTRICRFSSRALVPHPRGRSDGSCEPRPDRAAGSVVRMRVE
jgi:hypothetical protein